MIKERVLPADTFTVVNKTILQSSDHNILVMLYQPIIAADAINLYFSLCSYLDKLEIMSKSWTHHHLMTNMGMRLDNIVEAREKLEAVGLIKTYIKKGEVNEFVYELYSPISSKEFFENPLLNTLLYDNLGEAEYKNVLEYFRVPEVPLNDYEDITCKFQDVFEFENIKEFDKTATLRHRSKNKLDINSSIDLNQIFSSVPEEILNVRGITNDMRDFLYRISFVYGFNEEEMTNILKSSCTTNRTIDKDKFKEGARKYYQFEHFGDLPSLALKTQPEYLRKKASSTSMRDKKIYEFETTSPHDYLYSKHSGNRITSSETAILEYLLVEMNLNPGVVNVIIDYVLAESDNKLVPTYVEAVAGLFSRNHITTVEDAMALAEKEHKKRMSKTTKIKNTEKKPEWLNKKIEEVEATEEEQRKMQEWIERVVK